MIILKIFFFLYFLLYDFIKMINIKIIRSCFLLRVASFCKVSIQIYIFIFIYLIFDYFTVCVFNIR